MGFGQTQQCNIRQQQHSLPLNPIEVPSKAMAATLNPLKWSWCLMQASSSLTTSSLSKLVAWKPSLSGSLLGPAVNFWRAHNTACLSSTFHWLCVTYSSFCSGCKSFVAGKSDQGLLAKLFTIGGGTPLWSSLCTASAAAMAASIPLQQQEKYLILDKAFLATLIVPNGSFDFFTTISCSKSSRKITHLGIGCMAVSSPFLSHQACMHALVLKTFWSTCNSLHGMFCRWYQPLPQSSAEWAFCVVFEFLP